MDSLVGNLLIAIPELPDPNFFRSVVLVLQHTEDGASGVILNRPSNVTVAQVWDEVSKQACNSRQQVNIGGPVEGPLISLHSMRSLSELEIIEGLFMTLSRDNLNLLVNQHKHEYRVYSGYAGWGPQQLEGEIDQGGWLTVRAGRHHVFASPDDLWKSVCEHVGHDILSPHLKTCSLPADPSLN